VSNSRHVDALQRCRAHLADAITAIDNHYTADLVAVDLQSAVAALAEITGADVSESLLDTVFARFCIGK
jgi:tRNA modification GTPase